METTFGYDVKVKFVCDGPFGIDHKQTTLRNVKIVTSLSGEIDVLKMDKRLTDMIRKTYPEAEIYQWQVDWKQERI